MGFDTLVSFTFLIMGLWSLYQYIRQYLRNRRREFAPVIGTVVYMEEQYLTNGQTIYTPVYQYECGGLIYQKVHNDSTKLRDGVRGVLGSTFVVGSSIPLLVDRNEPEYAVVNDYSRHMLLWQSISFLVIGLYIFG